MIRFKWLIFAALSIQLAAVASHDVAITRSAMLVTYPALALVALLNAHLLGMRLILLGALLNFLVMAANGGLMPVDPDAIGSGQIGTHETRAIQGPVAGTKSVVISEEEAAFSTLADRFVIQIPSYGRKVASIGDIIIGAGFFVAVGQLSMRPTRRANVGSRTS